MDVHSKAQPFDDSVSLPAPGVQTETAWAAAHQLLMTFKTWQAEANSRSSVRTVQQRAGEGGICTWQIFISDTHLNTRWSVHSEGPRPG